MNQAVAPPTQIFLDSSLSHISKIKSIECKLSLHGISYTEFLIMHTLANSAMGRLKRIELAESLSMSASGITRSLKPMEKIGLIEKEAYERDARVSYVKLAPGGEKIYSEAAKTMDMAVETLA